MKARKLQRGMLLLWFSRGHVVFTLHSHNTNFANFVVAGISGGIGVRRQDIHMI